MPSHVNGQPSRCPISIDIADYQAYEHTLTSIPIFIDNPNETLLGFRIWVHLDRPEAIQFRVDSAIKFDTSGTLISGWELIDARSISGTGNDIQITAIANLAPPPFNPGLAPQTGGTLIRILADVFQINDPFSDSIVSFEINPYFPQNLEFVITDLHWTIWKEEVTLDTIGWVCTEWQIDSTQNPPDTIGCLDWVQTPFPPWDDTLIFLDTTLVLDTNKLCLHSGSVEILASPPYFCGDLNDDNTVGNILDLTFIVDKLFRGGPESNPPEAADVNCDGANGNILDLTAIVDLIFRSGPPLCNGGVCP